MVVIYNVIVVMFGDRLVFLLLMDRSWLVYFFFWGCGIGLKVIYDIFNLFCNNKF